MLEQKSSQHDRESSTRAARILELQRLIDQRNKEAADLTATIERQKQALNKADSFKRERDDFSERLKETDAAFDQLKAELGDVNRREDKLKESLTLAENDKLRARRDAESVRQYLAQVRTHKDDAEQRLRDFDELLNRPRGWGAGMGGERGGGVGGFAGRRRRG